MHEVSVARNIMEIVVGSVPCESLSSVRTVRVKVGDSSGVMPDALLFSFEALVQETPLLLARLVIDHVPFSIRCKTCGLVSTDAGGMAICHACGSPKAEILSGTELEVTEVELSDEEVLT